MTDTPLADETEAQKAEAAMGGLDRATSFRTRRWRLLEAVLLLGLVAALYGGLSAYWLVIVAQVCLYTVATMGLDILFGRTGQLSLSHASFFGLGAYVAALASAYGISYGLQLPIVLLIAVLAGAIVAVPTLRLSGLRLALVTLLFGQVLQWFLITEVSITGGSEGMTVTPLSIAGFNTGEPHVAFVVSLALAFVATVVTAQLSRTQAGRRMLAVRDSELAASACGIDLPRTKIQAFILAAIYAGFAGWLYAFVVGFVAPDTFSLFPSAYFLVAVILGGAGTVLGSWLGGAYIVLAPQLFTIAGQPNLFAILGGALLIVVALLMPGGLAGGISALQRRALSLQVRKPAGSNGR